MPPEDKRRPVEDARNAFMLASGKFLSSLSENQLVALERMLMAADAYTEKARLPPLLGNEKSAFALFIEMVENTCATRARGNVYLIEKLLREAGEDA